MNQDLVVSAEAETVMLVRGGCSPAVCVNNTCTVYIYTVYWWMGNQSIIYAVCVCVRVCFTFNK